MDSIRYGVLRLAVLALLGGVASPANAALVGRYSANVGVNEAGGNVTGWQDQVGDYHLFGLNTPELVPAATPGGMPAIDFDNNDAVAGDSSAPTGFPLAGATEFTAAVVFQPEAVVDNDPFSSSFWGHSQLISGDQGGPANDWGFSWGPDSQGANKVWFGVGDGVGGTPTTTVAGADLDNWYVAVASWNGNDGGHLDLSVYDQFGSLLGSSQLSVPTATAPRVDVGMAIAGERPNITARNFGGKIAAVELYDNAADATATQLIADGLLSTYLGASIAEPLQLVVNVSTGELVLENPNADAGVTLDSYLITSAAGQLNTAGWNSLDNQEFDTGGALPDGDFDSDGGVTLADYTVWRDQLGSSTPLAGDAALGTPVDAAHYALWKNHFGETQSGVGQGWTEAGGSGSELLSEFFLTAGGSTLAAASSLNLGSAYTGPAEGDLVFTYFYEGQVRQGSVSYISPAPGATATVPEPAAGVLGIALLAMAAIVNRYHRRMIGPLAGLAAIAVTCCVAAPGAEAAYTVERIASGLNQPVHMAQAPGDNNTLYIVERAGGGNQLGQILAYDPQSGTSSTFLDLNGTIISDGGLLSMTFHPDYQTNGLFYTVSNDAGTNGLDEWKVTGGSPTFQRRLMQYQNLDNVFHTMNLPMFRPGGNSNELFVVTGDGGTQANSPNFKPALVEDPDSPYGKLLRIDLNESFATPAGDPTADGVDVMALGLRNPYRASFDRATGDMYIGDVGFNSVEEVSFLPASHFSSPLTGPLNFGWSDREGTIETIANSAGGPKEPGDIDPIFEYAHHGGVPLDHPSELQGGSITGGFVYRGPVEELQGRYFFADFTSHQIYSGVFDPATDPGDYNGDNLTDLRRHDLEFEELVPGGADIQFLTSFAEDNAGNLYMIKFGNAFFPPLGQGEIFRISPAALEVVVNRDTGSIVLGNVADTDQAIEEIIIRSSIGAIDLANLTPVTGNYDAAGNGLVDSSDAWQITTATAELFEESTTGDAGSLGAGVSIELSPGGGWHPTPWEDLAVDVVLENGSVVSAIVSFEGNAGEPYMLGDLDFDGVVSRVDFDILTSNAYTTLGDLSPAESYALGDLTGNGQVTYEDFERFKDAYIALHGEAAFARLTAVPEPATMALMGTFVTAMMLLHRRRFAMRPPGR